MALVADYGSDSEENEEEPSKSICNPIEKKVFQSEECKKVLNHEEQLNVVNLNNLFCKLPHTKSKPQSFADGEDQIEDFIPKSTSVKEKQKVKISIPSLLDFKSDENEEPHEKKFKCSIKGTGLLSLLPPVKGSIKTAKSFVPNAVAIKNKVPISSQPKKVSSDVNKKRIVIKQTSTLQPTKKKKPASSDAESEDEDIETPETFDVEMWEKVCGRRKSKAIIKEPEPEITVTSVDIAPEPEKPYDGLNNEAFKELVGKTKRPIGNIKLIDINEEEILPDKDLWMTKSLTDPEMAPKATVEDPVDPTRRKKHHITFLAQQAKANEQELANAWAASKNNRLASRAKYGF